MSVKAQNCSVAAQLLLHTAGTHLPLQLSSLPTLVPLNVTSKGPVPRPRLLCPKSYFQREAGEGKEVKSRLRNIDGISFEIVSKINQNSSDLLQAEETILPCICCSVPSKTPYIHITYETSPRCLGGERRGQGDQESQGQRRSVAVSGLGFLSASCSQRGAERVGEPGASTEIGKPCPLQLPDQGQTSLARRGSSKQSGIITAKARASPRPHR